MGKHRMVALWFAYALLVFTNWFAWSNINHDLDELEEDVCILARLNVESDLLILEIGGSDTPVLVELEESLLETRDDLKVYCPNIS